MTDIIKLSKELMIDAHRNYAIKSVEGIGQVRKYTNERYEGHPIAVENIFSYYVDTDDYYSCVAHLHDVFEDTTMSETYIISYFESYNVKKNIIHKIITGMKFLTDVAKPEDGNRAYRTKLNIENVLKSDDYIKLIKCADILHNCKSIIEHDEKFADIWCEEKKILLDNISFDNKSNYANDLYIKVKNTIDEFLERDKL